MGEIVKSSNKVEMDELRDFVFGGGQGSFESWLKDADADIDGRVFDEIAANMGCLRNRDGKWVNREGEELQLFDIPKIRWEMVRAAHTFRWRKVWQAAEAETLRTVLARIGLYYILMPYAGKAKIGLSSSYGWRSVAYKLFSIAQYRGYFNGQTITQMADSIDLREGDRLVRWSGIAMYLIREQPYECDMPSYYSMLLEPKTPLTLFFEVLDKKAKQKGLY